jgi:uncharacterized membrane protein YkoI
MNVRIWKWFGLVVLVTAMVCAMTYADKQEAKNVTLPAAVKDAIKAAYPQGVIDKTKTEREFEVFEVIVKQNGQESEPSIAPDGTIIGVETKVGKETLPDTVAKALSKAAEGAEIKGIDKEVIYFVIKPVKLDAPETTYEAKLTKDGNECEVKLAANGTILDKSAWQKPEGKNEGKCGDNEDQKKDEQKVSIDQVPPAVKATILGQAGNGTVKEIEQENKDGKTIYGADIIIDGNKFEIKVSPDGKLLDKQAEGKDNEGNGAEKGK